MSRILGRDKQTIGLNAGEAPPERLPELEMAVYDQYVYKRERDQPAHRKYLGASDIGNDCARAVFYTFYHARKRDFPGQVLRLFETGHLQEERIENDLRSVGVIITTAAEDGGQHHFTDESGHFRVHLDGIIEPDGRWFHERMLVEMKTANKKSYDDLVDQGVKRSKPNYYRQMQMQMWAAKSLGVDKCLFAAVHKDTDKIYYELVHADPKVQQDMVDRAAGIIHGIAPPRVETSENAPPCRWCDYKTICRDDMLHLVEANCRTCHHGRTSERGVWVCDMGHPFGTICNDYQLKSEMQS